MVFKHYRVQIILRLLILSILSGTFFNLIHNFNFLFLTAFVALLFVAVLYNLFYYIDKMNRTFAGCLQTLVYSEFNKINNLENFGASYNELKQVFEKVKKDIQTIKLQKEEQIFYLNTLVQKINIGLLTYDENGKIELINDYAKTIFQNNNPVFLANLEESSPALVLSFKNLLNGQKNIFHALDFTGNKTYVIQVSHLVFRQKTLTLVTLHDIRSEMEEKEIESWQKLIRVLTHEIMNSVTPITSLASTASALLEDSASHNNFDPETFEDVKSAVNTISKRSAGLMTFVDSFRNLIKIPEPNFVNVNLLNLFDRIKSLSQNRADKELLEISYSVQPPDLTLLSDESLLEQAILNLLFNAMNAVKDCSSKSIQVVALQNPECVTISIIDNGPGIPLENIDKIFIPFFTTSKAGSGIGLSLVKQISLKLKGEISVKSLPDIETKFDLTFCKKPQ